MALHRPTGVAALFIKSQKRGFCYLSEYVYDFWKNPMIEKKIVSYTKISPSPSTPSSRIGKYQIHFEGGSEISPKSFTDLDFTWPSYPLIVDNEEHAKMYASCWESYLHAQITIVGKDD